MAIRRTAQNGNYGYGSFGQLVFANVTTEYFLRDEMVAVGLLLTANYAALVSVQSRWKWSLISAVPGRTQIYNARTGKSRYGSVITKISDYVCNDEFVSYNACIGQLNTTTFLVVNGITQDPLPCDEPPSDTQITVVQNAQWAPKSTQVSAPSTLGGFFPSVGGNADSYLYVPDANVTGYIFGGSFNWAVIQAYSDLAGYQAAGNPLPINL